MTLARRIRKALDANRRSVEGHRPSERFAKYLFDPRGYAKEVLGIDLTPDQGIMLEKLLVSPYRVFGRAGHSVGKSKAAAVAISWLYDTRDPGMVLNTAPRLESVRNIIWRELKGIRKRAGLSGFKTQLEMRDGEDHFAIGMTALNTYGFQGKHLLRNFIIIEEATGVDSEFFDAADSMLQGEEHGLLCIYNPLSTATTAYQEERSGRNHVVVMSCLDHPNIQEELQGRKAPYPSAVRLAWVITQVEKHTDPVAAGDENEETDFLWPPVTAAPSVIEQLGKPQWRRPFPIFDMRVRGQWPSGGGDTVWTEMLFKKARENRLEVKPHWRTAIGCDVARYGYDQTEIFVRRGSCVVHTESHGGWGTQTTCGRLKNLAVEFKGPEDPQKVRIFIDEPGLGAGVVDHGYGFNFIPVNPGRKPTDISKAERYVSVRDQLWFDGADIARKGLMDLSRLDSEQAKELERQLTAQLYSFQPTTGKQYCVGKDDMRKILKRSPDGADALNLCFAQEGTSYERRSRM